MKQQFSLTPTNFEEAWKFAEIIAESSLAPKNYANKPGDILVAIQMGTELGLKPMQSLANIAVVNGRASVWGDAVVAICMNHPLFGGLSEVVEGEGGAMVATCTVVRKGMETVVRTFTMAEAKLAGLAGKQGPWTQYPRRMLQMRARGFAVRDAFPDALRGLVSQEEAGDMEPIAATTVKVDRPAQEKLSPEAAAIQAEYDKPRETRHAAIDPELDPEDYVIKSGNKSGTPLGKLNVSQLEYLVNRTKDAELRLYAEAVLAQRKNDDTVMQEARKAETQEMIANDGWGLAGTEDRQGTEVAGQ
jgi:hypothetical protein